jgi:pimeloyl-ACP methyl ester carboxylesterase
MSLNGKKAELVSGFANVNRITITYEIFGPDNADAVVFIAGTGMQMTEWPDELMEGVAEAGFRAIRYDNRDCGLSTKFIDAGPPDSEAISKALQQGEPVPIPYTLTDMAKDAVALLDVLNIEKAHFVGVSMGGAIAQLVAINFPERVLSLCLIASDSGNKEIPVIAKPEAFADLPPAPQAGDLDGYIRYKIDTDKVLDSPGYPSCECEIAERIKKSIGRNYDPDALLRQQTAVFLDRFISSYRYDNLNNIGVPTMIIHGADDVLVDIANAEDLASNIINSQLIVIPGMNHSITKALVPKLVEEIINNVRQV